MNDRSKGAGVVGGLFALIFGLPFLIVDCQNRQIRKQFDSSPIKEGRIVNMYHHERLVGSAKCMGRQRLFNVVVETEGKTYVFTYWPSEEGEKIFENYRVGNSLKYRESFRPFDEYTRRFSW